MRECWINVYHNYNFESKYWYGCSWKTLAEAKENRCAADSRVSQVY